MQNVSLLLICTLLCISSAFSQKATLSGFVYDIESGERLINANVFEKETYQGTTSNTYGFYSLTLPQGIKNITFSFIGYNTLTLPINLQKDSTLNIGLQLKQDETIEEVTVYGNSVQKIESSQMSMVEVPITKLEKLPAILGEPDVLKVIQLLPGVQSGTEGTSGIYVRGGGPDQNLFMLDGVPVYNASHLLGFFSVFNPGAVKTVKLYKGGFPARFGGRLSSVVDIRMKEGNMKKIKGEASLGLISSRFTLEGPIFKDKTSFVFSGRRTYVDLLAKPIVALANKLVNDNQKVSAGYYFYDMNAKINHIFSEKSRLYLSAYMGKDIAYTNTEYYFVDNHIRFDQLDKMSLNWGNITSALRWNYVFNSKLFRNTTVTYSNYKFDISTLFEVTNTRDKFVKEDFFNYYSGIEDISAKIDFDYYPDPNHSLKFGADAIRHQFKPGVNHIKFEDQADTTGTKIDTIYGNDNIAANEVNLFIEDNFNIGSRLKVNMGLHYSLFNVQQKTYHSLQPRLSARFKANDKFSIKGSYSKMTQNIHLLTTSTISLPADLWLPTTKRVKPQMSQQVALGTFFNIGQVFDLSVEGYYKWMDNLLEYKEGASFAGTTMGWEDKVELGKGWSYGVEFLLEKQVGKTTGWIGYTLAWANRQFENLNFGEIFPAKYDRRHDLSFVLTHKFSDKFDIGLTWVYGTGNSVTLGVQEYPKASYPNDFGYYYGNTIDYYESRNNYKMPAYHRLDLGMNFHREMKFGIRTINVSFYNAYSRQNPFYLYWGHDYVNGYDENGHYFEDSTPALKQMSLFPLIPSVSYTYKF